jgi:hypothetical protein
MLVIPATQGVEVGESQLIMLGKISMRLCWKNKLKVKGPWAWFKWYSIQEALYSIPSTIKNK